jgi:SET domain-containing protein
LQDYVFALKKAPDSSLTAYAIVLGISSIMNHSHDRANATWAVNSSRRLFVFKSLKPIRSGEEVLIDYDNA